MRKYYYRVELDVTPEQVNYWQSLGCKVEVSLSDMVVLEGESSVDILSGILGGRNLNAHVVGVVFPKKELLAAPRIFMRDSFHLVKGNLYTETVAGKYVPVDSYVDFCSACGLPIGKQAGPLVFKTKPSLPGHWLIAETFETPGALITTTKVARVLKSELGWDYLEVLHTKKMRVVSGLQQIVLPLFKSKLDESCNNYFKDTDPYLLISRCEVCGQTIGPRFPQDSLPIFEQNETSITSGTTLDWFNQSAPRHYHLLDPEDLDHLIALTKSKAFPKRVWRNFVPQDHTC